MFDFFEMIAFGQQFKDADGTQWVMIQAHQKGWVSAVKAKDKIPARIYLVQNPELVPKDKEAEAAPTASPQQPKPLEEK